MTDAVDTIARVCHEANRALQIAQDDPTIPVAPTWDECGDEMRESARAGVLGVLEGNTPEQSHDQWVRFKVTHGWTLGPVKDEEKKQHPLLVPYDELPESQRIKDELFVAIVRALTGTSTPAPRPVVDEELLRSPPRARAPSGQAGQGRPRVGASVGAGRRMSKQRGKKHKRPRSWHRTGREDTRFSEATQKWPKIAGVAYDGAPIPGPGPGSLHKPPRR